MTTHLFGWVPPAERTAEQHEADERALASMPKFSLQGTYRDEKGRFALWAIAKKVNGDKHIPFAWQVTGSCVGAGGGNMLRVLARVEISQGDPEEYQELWWPYTYGQSRLRAGWNREGEGSFGSTWAAAIVQDGIFSVQEATGLPTFKDAEGWLQLSNREEMKWSAGGWSKEQYGALGLKHPVKTSSKLSSADEAKAALANGYPLTIASNFGTSGPRRAGDPEVMLAEWNDNWPHQMSINEAWDHPTLGLIFHVQNNWGPRAHGEPLGGVCPGGFYIKAATLDRILRDEGFAFSAFEGFKVREISWYI